MRGFLILSLKFENLRNYYKVHAPTYKNILEMQINRRNGVLGQDLTQPFVPDFIGKRQIHGSRKDAGFRIGFFGNE